MFLINKLISRNKNIKSLIRLNTVLILSIFFLLSTLVFYKSYQTVGAAEEKELAFLLEQERVIINERYTSYKMTLEAIQSLIENAINKNQTLDEEAINAVTMALISSQHYVYSLFYAFEPRYAKQLKNKDYYIYASLKNLDLIGSDEFSSKKNIKTYEYFDGNYYTDPDGSNKKWYHDAKERTDIFITDPYFDDPYLQFTMITVVLPIKGKNGEFAGIVGLDLPLSVLNIENAKRTRALNYRTLITDQNGNTLESLIQESNFKYPDDYSTQDVFKFDAKNTTIRAEGRFKIQDHNGLSYTAFSTRIFDGKFKLVVIKSKNATAAVSGLYKDILIALLALLPFHFFLTRSISNSIYKKVRILINNFRSNTLRIKVSKDHFKPIPIKDPLEYDELEEVKEIWTDFLHEYHKVLREIKIEKDKSLKALEFQSLFLANMSHEIRTPINAIVGMVELLKETPLTAEQKEILKIFSGSSDNLITLLNDIIDLVKIESGSLRIEKVETSLHKIKEDTLMVYKEKANLKNLSFKFEIEDDVNPYIITDPIRLKQIIFNLVGNAIKFTEKGEVKVTVRRHPKKSKKLIITTKDTGIGIAKNKTKYIFKKFAQADASTTRKYGGSGLGLSIIRSLLRLMHGAIYLKSEEGVGSEFIITLPVEYHKNYNLGYEPKSLLPPSPVLSQEQVNKRNFKMLIADDVFENRLLLSMYAQHIGIKCDLAENGEEAVNMAKDSLYDIIILDIQMPIKDGSQAYKEIRNLNNTNKDVPIIAFSAYASKSDEEKYLAEGFSIYLTKPLSRDTFIQCLSQFL